MISSVTDIHQHTCTSQINLFSSSALFFFKLIDDTKIFFKKLFLRRAIHTKIFHILNQSRVLKIKMFLAVEKNQKLQRKKKYIFYNCRH